MKTHSIFKYFALGYNHRCLQGGVLGWEIHGKPAESVESLLQEFLAHLDELDLRVTRRAATKIFALREALKALPDDAVADQQLVTAIEQALSELDPTLDAELQLRDVYIVTPKRFATESLLHKPWDLLADDTRLSMPNIAAFDYVMACRCVAFALPTSAAFHLMRMIEALLREYYLLKVKRKRMKVPMWGPMIDQLKRMRKPPPKVLLDHLDNIRSNFRNPTQHPDAVYTLDEVQDLLAVALDAANRLGKELPKVRAVGVFPIISG
jgi:hypothetical protein